jgi:hypothetical protein
MNAFLRGNRDTQPRSQSGSILQQLALMNDPFVTARIRLPASPVLQEAAKLDDAGAVDLLFLSFLSRRPEADERDKALAQFRAAVNRNAALEDLAWALVNKVEFVFSH